MIKPLTFCAAMHRHKFFSVLFFLLMSFTVSSVYAQQPDVPQDPGEICNMPSCTTGSINISTGFNQATGTYQTPLASETNWQLVAVPIGVAMSVPAPSYVIAPAPPWSLFPNAKWVSPYTHWQHQFNNLPLSEPGGTGPYRFQKCFCLCQPAQIHFKYSLLADDQTETFVDGIKLASGLTGGHYVFPEQLEVDTVITLGAGQHCISVDLYNVGLSAFGFSVEGSVSGNLVSPLCCNAKGSICGYKLKDLNCDGDVDPSVDPGVPGFTITLYNFSGTPIASTVTDATGHYCFTELSPATYTVAEVNQPGWTQTYPSTGSHSVVVPPSGSVEANFGNCAPVCESLPDPHFDTEIDRCMVRFTPIIGTIPYGYQVVSTTWVFGDGYSSNEQHPTHSYLTPGSYDVCLKVVFFNGEQCCTKEFCDRVDIADKCEGGCKFDTKIDYTFDEENCLFDFSGIVANPDAPITSWYWDFGDGSAASGSQVIHQFPRHGDYTVCLYQFATTDGSCCYEKVCMDIHVECDPQTHHGAMKVNTPVPMNNITQPAPQKKVEQGTLKAPVESMHMIILDQNVPNPFAESTVISYSVPAKYKKAQIIFANKNGKMIKTYDVPVGGEGKLTVYGNDLSTGLYSYTLIVDGKATETKTMLKH